MNRNSFDNYKFIEESFTNYLKKEIGETTSTKKILDKGEYIIKELDKYQNKKDRKGLLVGKVQSGKTMNFMAVIMHAFKLGYHLVVVLTSIENKLHEQTTNRLKKAFGEEENKNFLKFYDASDFKNNEDYYRESIIDEIDESGSFHIITSLKNTKINFITKLFETNYFKKQKILVIDDEGDLASMSYKEDKENKDDKDSKTLEWITKLLNNINYTYISVTATPQVHFMTKEDKFLLPNRVFTINPGEKYIGIDYFEKHDDLYVVSKDNQIENSNWNTTLTFQEAILYYLIITAYSFEKNIFTPRSHTNMLIHTDVKTVEHEKNRKSIKVKIEYFKNILKNHDDISFKEFDKDIKNTIGKYSNLKNLKIEVNKEFYKNLSNAINWTKIYVINQNDKKSTSNINSNQISILIGSKMLERGITLDNLIVTFFTNISKSQTAVDTLLQRARWFGYRQNIIENVKVFCTEKIVKTFKDIAKHNENLWDLLENADVNKIPFDEIRHGILLTGSNLKPTGKVPIVKESISNKIFGLYYNILRKYKSKIIKLVDKIKQGNEEIFFSNKYKFQCLNLTISELCQFLKIDDLAEIFCIDRNVLEEIFKNERIQKIKVALLTDVENKLEPRIRSFDLIYESDIDYKIKQLFQGENPSSNSENYYVGDSRWQEVSQYQNDLFLQIYYIRPKLNNELSNDTIYDLALLIPKSYNLPCVYKPKE